MPLTRMIVLSTLVDYDNSASGLLATNVKDAIDELSVGPDANLKRGHVDLVASNTADVVFAAAYADDSYAVTFGPNENLAIWHSDKVATGFKIHASAIFTGRIDWMTSKE